MIYPYNNRGIGWMAAAIWILAEFLLFHYLEKSMPKRLEEGPRLWIIRIACWNLLTYLQIEQMDTPFFYNYFFRISLLILYTTIVNQVSFLLAGYVTIVFYLVKDICKMALLNVLCPFFNLPVVENPWMNTCSMTICVLMQFFILRQVRRSIRMDEQLSLKKTDIAAMLFPTIPYALIKYLQMISYSFGKQQDIDTAIVCLMLCICDLIVFLQTDYWITTQKIREEAEALRTRSQAQQEWYCHEQEKIEEINKIYHDIKHHLNYIRTLSDNKKIQEYVNSITEEMNPCEIFSSTGNEVIDSVLAKSGADCTRLGIRLIPSIHGEIFHFMEPKDLLVIFGNALDNAKEAVRQLEQNEQREIIVRADARQNFAVLRIENHFFGHVSFDRAGGIKTTKKESAGHGYGIKNIQSAAKRYGGEVSIELEGSLFILTVMIPIQ